MSHFTYIFPLLPLSVYRFLSFFLFIFFLLYFLCCYLSPSLFLFLFLLLIFYFLSFLIFLPFCIVFFLPPPPLYSYSSLSPSAPYYSSSLLLFPSFTSLFPCLTRCKELSEIVYLSDLFS